MRFSMYGSWSDSLRAMLNSRIRKRSLSARHTEEYKVCCPTASLLTHSLLASHPNELLVFDSTTTRGCPPTTLQLMKLDENGPPCHNWMPGVSFLLGMISHTSTTTTWSVVGFVQVHVMPFRVSCDFWLDRCHEKILGSRATNKEVMSETNCEIS